MPKNITQIPTKLMAIILFSIVGFIFILVTSAATPTASFEPENGTKTVNVNTVSDISASGAQAIQFDQTTSGNTIPVVGTQAWIDRVLYTSYGEHENNFRPHGVPSSWSWYAQSSVSQSLPPIGFTGFNPWGWVYLGANESGPTIGTFQINHQTVWVQTTTGWVKTVTDPPSQSRADEGGGYWAEPFNEPSHGSGTVTKTTSGRTIDLPVYGDAYHFWAGIWPRVEMPTNATGKIIATFEASISDASRKYGVGAGYDWYPTPDGFGLVDGSVSKFIVLTTSPQLISITNMSATELQTSHPNN